MGQGRGQGRGEGDRAEAPDDVASYNTPAQRSELLDMAKRAEAGGHRADAAVLQDLLLP